MNIIVTTLNKTVPRDKQGIQFHVVKPNAGLYLLGRTKVKETKKFVTYVPERVSYQIEIPEKKFLQRYLLLGFNVRKPYMRRRKVFVEQIYNHQKLFDFLRDYHEFIKENPTFTKNRRSFYKKPFPEEKSKKKLVNGKWVKQYRMITEPKPELKSLQTSAYEIIRDIFGYRTNDNTHSYTANRSNITNAQPHQLSEHIVKTDISKFFDSIDKNFLRTSLHSLKEFAILQIQNIDTFFKTPNYNHRAIINLEKYHRLTKQFIDAVMAIAIYKGGLPQGSPLSPILSNIVMAKYDILIEDFCKSRIASKNKIIYTRYSDDMTFSSFKPIKLNKLLPYLNGILSETPLRLHPDKTQYLKPATQRVFITGVKINREHRLSYGHEKKEILKRDIFLAMMAVNKGQEDLKENQEVIGRINYAMQIEPDHIRQIVSKYARKFGVFAPDFYKHLTVFN